MRAAPDGFAISGVIAAICVGASLVNMSCGGASMAEWWSLCTSVQTGDLFGAVALHGLGDMRVGVHGDGYG